MSTTRMSVLLLSNDLMTWPTISGAAQRLGHPAEMAATIEQFAKQLQGDSVKLVIVDLAMPGLDPADVVCMAREANSPAPKIIAYGPHVHEQRLEAARGAGCDEVFSRGQFHARLVEILGQYLT